MAYEYEGEATTRKGTIVYKRKPHLWTMCSLRRPAKNVGFPEDKDGKLCHLDILEFWLNGIALDSFEGLNEAKAIVIGAIQATRYTLENSDPFQESGSGQFGGGGASRGIPIRPAAP